MMPQRDMPFIERMARISGVAWSRKPTGGYWVMWEQDGLLETADFDSAYGAQSFAAWLDTTGQQPTVREVKDMEKAFRELEEAVEEHPTPKQVRELRELGVPMMTPRERRLVTRKMRQLEPLVHVKRYPRRRRATH